MDNHILFIDDDNTFLAGQRDLLSDRFMVSITSSLDSAFLIIEQNPVDLVFLDVNFGLIKEGINYLRVLKEKDPSLVVIMLSGCKDPDLVVRAIKNGADDYICKPCPIGELIGVIEKNLSKKSEKDKSAALIEYCNDQKNKIKFLTNSEKAKEVLRKAGLLKGHNTNILIEGESGTGKEVLAKYIHSLENNPKRPFIALNCAAIPDNLLESELFGYERGAFTGAIKRKIGKFELADKGDIFLDEINSLKPDFQAKLLRILQEKEFYRVGGTVSVKVNVRVIVASNKDLQTEVLEGRFRQDLFYRLRVIALTIPPLRDRPEDVSLLFNHFIKTYKKNEGSVVFSQNALKVIQGYSWPGNVRELENLVQSLLIVSGHGEIKVENLPVWMLGNNKFKPEARDLTELTHNEITRALNYYIEKHEKLIIKKAIEENKGNTTEAAKVLNISRSTLYNKLNKEGLDA
ncbi:MAG: sigma-54-dependent Fis family transcriptional regulator [Deltaproteobacteria bacterium]|nr:sigma-54-dependent Fis family transcriptional regulator [Deltaproteobacteria bacterium]